MFVSRLSCPECGWASEAFDDGENLFDRSWDLLFRNNSTGAIEVRRVRGSVIDRLGVDVFAAAGQEQVQDGLAKPGETFVDTRRGECPTERPVSIDARCPDCGQATLQKVLAGLA